MMVAKHNLIWSLAARNLIRFPWRSLAIFIPLFIVMAYASVMIFVKDGISRDALILVNSFPDIIIQQTSAGRLASLETKLLKEISLNSNVRKATPRVWGYIPVPGKGGAATYILMGIDPEQLPAGEDISLTVEDGRFLKPADKDCVVIGKTLAFRNGLKAGDKIILENGSGDKVVFSVIGIFASSSRIATSNLILTDIKSAGGFLGYSRDEFSDLSVYLKEPAYSGQIAETITSAHKNIRAITKDALANRVKRAYGGKSGIFLIMWQILLLTVLILAWGQSSSISLEMKKEIGILKAVGWQALDIIELKMLESVIVGMLGILGGVIFGILYLQMGAPLVKEYFLGWANAYPEFPIPVYIEWRSLFLLFVIGLFPLCAATVVSAWLMGTIEPDNAIRSA